MTSFHEYPGIQGHLKGLTLCLIPATSPQKNQFNCHKRAALPLPGFPGSPASASIPTMEISLIKRAYCLWCHGYPVITHSVAAPPPFALKPRRDLLPPKSNQLSPLPPHSPLISCQTGGALHCQQARMAKAGEYLKRGCDCDCEV